MLNLSNFLAKFKQLDFKKSFNTSVVLEVILATSNIKLSTEEVSVKSEGEEGGVLFIKSSPLKRNEIIMSKEKILTALNNRGQKIRDIR